MTEWTARWPRLSRRTLVGGLLAGGALTALTQGGSLVSGPLSAWADTADYATAREQWRRYLLGPDLDRSIPAVADRLASLARTARSWLTAIDTSPDRVGLWPDLPLAARTSFPDSERVTQTTRRLRDIAMAWATDSLGTDADAAAAAVADGLTWLSADVFAPEGPFFGNWYVWGVSAPQALNDVLLLIGAEVDPAVTATLLQTQRNAYPGVPTSGSQASAANRALLCDSICGRGLLGEVAADVETAVRNTQDVLVYATPYGSPPGQLAEGEDPDAYFSHDGFYLDGSFIQHGEFAYVGGYGASFLNSVNGTAARVTGTGWRLDTDIVVDWFHASFEPWLWRGLVMDTVRGRGLATVNGDKQTGRGFISGALNLAAAVTGEQRARLHALVKAELLAIGDDEPNLGLSLPQLSVAADLLGDTAVTPRPPLVGTWIFGPMDRVLHRRADWAVAVALHSWRTANYEMGLRDNFRGWYTADAATYLYTDDVDQFGNAFWCLVDAQRIPGTTIDTVPREPVGLNWRAEYNNPRYWAGGVSAGGWGAAGIDLVAEPPSTLTVRTARFFFDDCFVCTGSGIAVASDREAETVLENRQVTAVSRGDLLVDDRAVAPLGSTDRIERARWAHLDGVAGYVLHEPATLRCVHERRTGRLSDISLNVTGTTGTTLREGEFVTLAIEHGAGVRDARYAYAVHPGADAATTAAEATAPITRVLSNSPAVQGVRHEPSGRWAATFFEAGEVSLLSSDQPCAVTVEETDERLVLHVSDPSQEQSVVRLRLAITATSVVAADPRFSVRIGDTAVEVEVDVDGLTGDSLALELAWTAPRPAELARLVRLRSRSLPTERRREITVLSTTVTRDLQRGTASRHEVLDLITLAAEDGLTDVVDLASRLIRLI